MSNTETQLAFDRHSTQFDEIEVAERSQIIDLNAINPLSQLREDWSNASITPSEHLISIDTIPTRHWG